MGEGRGKLIGWTMLYNVVASYQMASPFSESHTERHVNANRRWRQLLLKGVVFQMQD